MPTAEVPRPEMTLFSGNWNYPKELPVVEHREEILAAIRAHPVVVVVSETGSGKTTQLPKMVAEALGVDGGRIGCTQPRRLAAASVSKRVAEELQVPLGDYVGYQVRFEDRTSRETRIKFMTDGILLAETQGDRDLKQYEALILDEAHERSLNIDFLLGYVKRLLERRKDLKLVISSATLDAGSFAEFFSENGVPAPVIEAPGRMFPVAEFFLPPFDDEDLAQHVARAVDYLGDVEPNGDVLIFLPGEREIRECADVLDGRQYRGTEVLPLFARLGLGDQQRVFNPGNKRRLILATNVAETSLTIPRIACVIDTGIARVSRWSPGKGVQRLQIEPVSQASARQRKGRCGRVRDGVCVRLYEETELTERPEFTDPEIRRSSLAGVILRMKALNLPEIDEFPFLDPPSPKAVSEGYRTLREVNALDKEKRLTDYGRQIARLPVDPRLGRMLIEARKEHCLAEVLPIVAALESSDPRERPAEKDPRGRCRARQVEGRRERFHFAAPPLERPREIPRQPRPLAAQRPAEILRTRLPQRPPRDGVGERPRRTRRSAGARVEDQDRRNRRRSIRRGELRHAPQGAARRRAAAVRRVGPRVEILPQREWRLLRGVSRLRPVCTAQALRVGDGHGARRNLAAVGAAGC